MTANDLHERLRGATPPTLIHVLPEEVFEALRIASSHNACIYETAFGGKMGDCVPEKGTPLVVYGAGEGSADATTAAERLRELGYTSVEVFEGGLDAWQAAGLPTEGTGRLPAEAELDGTFALDPAASVIRWTGRNLFNDHRGTVKFASGELVLEKGALISARFVIDMNSIGCDDLADSALNAMLIAHLRTTDFFDVAQHPTAEFTATSAERLAASTVGTPNWHLRGNFTLRGVTQPLALDAAVATADGASLTAQATLELDRTPYGSHYGSGRFFRFLGKHVVNDHVSLALKVVAQKRA